MQVCSRRGSNAHTRLCYETKGVQKFPLPDGKIFRPAPHPFGLCVDNCLSAFPKRVEQVLISLGARFKQWPKVLDEMEPVLPEVLLGLCPTQEQLLSLLHVLAQLGRASRRDLDAPGPVTQPPGLGIERLLHR